jgi:hypothetical protein
LPWDDGVGRIVGREAASIGPQSFAVKSDGGVFVLDQVNARVIDLDAAGRVMGTVPLPATTYDDIEQVEGWAILALDRLVGKSLLVMDRQGVCLNEIALEGRGIAHAGWVTAMLPRDDGVWLEVRHRYSVRVLDRDLQPCQRRIVLGRPVDRTHSLHGKLDGRGGADIWRDRRNGRGALAAVHIGGRATRPPVYRIVWLDADLAGRVFVVLHEALFAPQAPFAVEKEVYRIVVMDARLDVLAERESPWVLTRYDQRVEFRIGPAGRIWQMAFEPDGVVLLRWDWMTP